MGAAETKRDLIAMLPRLRRFARSLVTDPADADDLLREVCLRAVSRGPGAGASLDRWMYRVLRNLAVDEARRTRPRAAAEPVPAEEGAGNDSAKTGDSEPRDAALGLPEGMTSVVILVAVEGYSYREAADILGIPVAAVMSRLGRARRTVADMGLQDLSRMGGGPRAKDDRPAGGAPRANGGAPAGGGSRAGGGGR